MHRKEGKNVLAVCDKEACNQTFEDGNLQIFVDPAFYGVKEVEEKELVSLFEEANIINLAGRLCVDLAIRLGYVDPENVLEIDTCAHAQVLRI
jgi:hypothetical protein